MKEIINEIGDILDTYCQPCTKTMNLSDSDKATLCAECQVGQKLMELGKYLGGQGIRQTRKRNERRVDLSKEQYLAYKENQYTDLQICNLLNMGNDTLNKRKREWGISIKRGPKT